MFSNFSGTWWPIKPTFKPVRKKFHRIKEVYIGGPHLLLSHIKRDIRRYGQVSYPVVGLNQKF